MVAENEVKSQFLVLDVHGMSLRSAMEEFRSLYSAALSLEPRRDIKIIHGYGSSGKAEAGVIGTYLEHYLKIQMRHNVTEVVKISIGAMIVSPRGPLYELSEAESRELEKIVASYRGISDAKATEYRVHQQIILGEDLRAEEVARTPVDIKSQRERAFAKNWQELQSKLSDEIRSEWSKSSQDIHTVTVLAQKIGVPRGRLYAALTGGLRL
ncbi:MAG: Smr/MutS family protein [Methylacidiphilales bacterium]|nr:Smr/MutS family protein [Candidatus Methylacidiphilales bacterium]